ncbi:unnamed protein product [Closterium sp. NIES-65]|nr:unnamed protein product [Closterium sp. NIES-65]
MIMPVRPCSAVHHVAQPVGRPNTKQYIVHLSSVPSVLSYRGGVHGLRATATVDDEDDEYEDEEDVDDLDDENLVDGDAIGDGNGGMGGSGVNATAPGSAPEAESGAAAAVAESEVKLTTSESGDDGFDADIHFASAAAAEAAMEMAGVVTGAGAAAGKEGIAGVAATAVAGGRGVGGGSRGGAVRVSALPFGRTGVDALVERVAVSTTTANAVHSTSAAVLTVQQLSARAARIMRSTPWGRLIRPDVRLPHVQAFTRFLEASHRSLLQSLKIPSSAIFHSYTYLMNSFAAQLTASEARRLKLHPAVAEVERDRTVEVASVHSPEFLKLDSSLWPANGGQSNAGEGVIIGVIDSGIWPEHPSFSDLFKDFQPFQAILSSPPLLFSSPPLLPSSPPLLLSSSSSLRRDTSGVSYSTAPVRWRGVCSKTDDFTACSRKVVGARYFLKGAERAFGQVNTMDDYRSPRHARLAGHAAHAAAQYEVCEVSGSGKCSGQKHGVEVTKGGQTHGTASGMAWVLQKFHTYLLAITPLPSSLPLQSCWWKRRAAAGNAGVEVTVGGRTFGTASGMAPRARLAVYKALWMALDMKYGVKGKGSTSDLIAAAEKAVADGVDVISCSWGGLALYFQDLPYLRGLKNFQPAAEKAVADGVDVISCSWGGLVLYFQGLPYLRGLKHSHASHSTRLDSHNPCNILMLPILTLPFTPSRSNPPILTLPFSLHSHPPITTLPFSTSHSHPPILNLSLLFSPSHFAPPILTLPLSPSRYHPPVSNCSFSPSHSHPHSPISPSPSHSHPLIPTPTLPSHPHHPILTLSFPPPLSHLTLTIPSSPSHSHPHSPISPSPSHPHPLIPTPTPTLPFSPSPFHSHPHHPILTLPFSTAYSHPSILTPTLLFSPSHFPTPIHTLPFSPSPSHSHLLNFPLRFTFSHSHPLAGVVTAFAAGNKGRPKRMSMQGALSNASPFYLTVGARITQQCSPWAMEPPSQHAFSLPSTQVHPPSPPCTTAPSLNILGRDYTAVLTLGNRTKFPRHLPIHPHRPPPLPTAPHRSTMGRDYTAVLNLGDGTTFTGRSLGGNTATASPLPLMLAGDYTTVGLPDDVSLNELGAAAVLVLNATVTRETQYRVPFSKTPAIFLEKRLQWFIEEYIRAAGSPSPQLSSNLPPLFPPPPPPILYPLFPPISPLKPPIFIPLLPPRSLDRIPLPFPPLYSNPTLPLGRQISFPSLCPLVSCNVPLLPPLPPFPSPPPSPSPPLSIHLHTHAFHFHHLPVLNFSLPPPPSPLSNPLPPCQCSPTATLSAFTVSYDTNAPQVAYFSSTGPPRSPLYPPALLIRDYPTNDILKPDVVGPGFQLWAAGPGKTAATAATDLPEFGYKSGTSMSTAHLAGIMALIVQNKPSWSPSQVISAITTTAYTRNKNGQPIQRADGKNANGWDYGGGHVDPTRVLDPGLTFHAAHKHFVNFLMMRDPIRTKKRFWRMGKAHPILPWNLNRASIAEDHHFSRKDEGF